MIQLGIQKWGVLFGKTRVALSVPRYTEIERRWNRRTFFRPGLLQAQVSGTDYVDVVAFRGHASPFRPRSDDAICTQTKSR